MSLQTHLAALPEFRRQNKNFRHYLVDILPISVLATLCGADDFEQEYLRKGVCNVLLADNIDTGQRHLRVTATKT